MTLKLPFLKSDPAQQDHQYLEDLATAYWYSEVLFGAIELELFARLDGGDRSLASLAEATRCRPHELARLMTALERLALVHYHKGLWTNSQLARCYLVPGRSEYIGDLLLYRRYMQPSWHKLASAVAQRGVSFDQSVTYDSDYPSRNQFYVQALDALARRKAIEIVELLNCLNWPKSVIDIRVSSHLDRTARSDTGCPPTLS